MKSVRFSKVVEKCGKPEVYLLMSETDPEFHKALEAGKIMSLVGRSHGAGTEYGTVGYDKKRHGQLLLFPKSLKSFADAKIVGIKYDLFAEDHGMTKRKSPPLPGRKLRRRKLRNRSPQRNRLQRKRPKRKRPNRNRPQRSLSPFRPRERKRTMRMQTISKPAFGKPCGLWKKATLSRPTTF